MLDIFFREVRSILKVLRLCLSNRATMAYKILRGLKNLLHQALRMKRLRRPKQQGYKKYPSAIGVNTENEKAIKGEGA